jgi:hypothetical protein
MQSVSALTTGDAAALGIDRSQEGAVLGPAPLEYAAEPWGSRELIRFVALSVASLVLLAVGWLGAGGEALLEEQMPFLDVAVAGLLVGAAGGALWVIAGIRAVRSRKAVVKALVAVRAGGTAAGAASVRSDMFVAGAAMTRFHRPDCSLVAGKELAAATRVDHQRAGRRACGMCAPTGERG